MVKYSEINLKLTETNGNAFAILGKLQAVLGKHKVPQNEIDTIVEDATSGDYNHLLQVVMQTVNVE